MTRAVVVLCPMGLYVPPPQTLILKYWRGRGLLYRTSFLSAKMVCFLIAELLYTTMLRLRTNRVVIRWKGRSLWLCDGHVSGECFKYMGLFRAGISLPQTNREHDAVFMQGFAQKLWRWKDKKYESMSLFNLKKKNNKNFAKLPWCQGVLGIQWTRLHVQPHHTTPSLILFL